MWRNMHVVMPREAGSVVACSRASSARTRRRGRFTAVDARGVVRHAGRTGDGRACASRDAERHQLVQPRHRREDAGAPSEQGLPSSTIRVSGIITLHLCTILYAGTRAAVFHFVSCHPDSILHKCSRILYFKQGQWRTNVRFRLRRGATVGRAQISGPLSAGERRDARRDGTPWVSTRRARPSRRASARGRLARPWGNRSADGMLRRVS